MIERVYISGKITGLPKDECIERFAEAEEELTDRGYKVINPTRIMEYDLSYSEFMAIDLMLLQSCDVIYMLDNWERSEGANIEWHMANKEGMEVIFQKTDKLRGHKYVNRIKKEYCSKCTKAATCEVDVKDCILDSI